MATQDINVQIAHNDDISLHEIEFLSDTLIEPIREFNNSCIRRHSAPKEFIIKIIVKNREKRDDS